MNKDINIKKLLGFVSLAVAVLCWIITPILPFTEVPYKVIVTTVVIIIGEVFFVIAVALLGKEYWGKIKQGFKTLFYKKCCVK